MRVIAAAFVGVALAVAGCGGDEETPIAAADRGIVVEAASVSKAEFVRRANQICQDTKNRFLREYAALLKARDGTAGGQDALAVTVVRTMLVPDYEALIDEMSAVGAPSADAEEIEAFLAALQAELVFAEQQPAQALSNRDLFKRASDRAARYGLAVCVETLG